MKRHVLLVFFDFQAQSWFLKRSTSTKAPLGESGGGLGVGGEGRGTYVPSLNFKIGHLCIEKEALVCVSFGILLF